MASTLKKHHIIGLHTARDLVTLRISCYTNWDSGISRSQSQSLPVVQPSATICHAKPTTSIKYPKVSVSFKVIRSFGIKYKSARLERNT